MDRPTYIAGDFRKSKFFNNESRIVLGTYKSNISGNYSGKDNLTNLIRVALEQKIKAFDFDPELASSYKMALKSRDGNMPFLSSVININEYSRIRNQSFCDDYMLYLLESLDIGRLDLLFIDFGNLNESAVQSNILDRFLKMKEDGLVKMIGITGNQKFISKSIVQNKNFNVFKGSNRLNACNLDALLYDIPFVRNKNIAYYNTSVLHNDLLGNLLEQYSREKPDTELISDRDVNIAVRATRLASQYGLSLSSLATRYSWSINEADRIVIELKNPEQMESLVMNIKGGSLSEELFNKITDNIIGGYKSGSIKKI